MALSQDIINVGAAPNDGQGDPIRTAFIKCNDNFTQLYSLPNPTPPATLIGTTGDMPGMYAYDDTYFYYCYAPYNGVSTVWGQLVQSDESVPSIGNGLSNVVIAFANANVTVGVNGTGNVGVFSPLGLTVRGALNSNTITTGSLVSGNFIIAGDTISSLGETITITPAGNIIYNDVVVNSSVSIRGPRTTTESKVLVVANSAANATVANLSGIQIGSANYASFLYDTGNSHWYATGNITADGYHVNGGNINGGFNATFSNTVSANTFFGNTIEGTLIRGYDVIATHITGNTIAGDGEFISNIQGANVNGTVQFANIANIASNAYNANYAVNAGTVINSTQPNITSVGILTNLQVAGNVNSNAISTTGNITSLAVITAPYIGTAPDTILRGTLSGLSNAQPNITSVGTLTSLTAGNITSTGDVAVFGNVYAGNIIGNIIATTKYAELVTNNNQPNITSVGNLNGLIVNSYILINGNVIANNDPIANTSISARNIFGNIIGSSLYTSLRGTLAVGSNAQPNITSVGNLVSINVNGDANFGPSASNVTVISGNSVSSGGATTTLNLGYNVIIPGNLNVQGTTVTVNSNTITINDLFINVANNASSSALANGGGIGVGPVGSEYASLYYVAVTDSWNMDAPLNVAGNISAPSFNWANGNPVVSSNGSLSVSTISATGNISTTGNISAPYFIGIATSAQYADLAENYLADAKYLPGTVVSFGGPKEITVSTQNLDVLVAGIISTDPAYLMNSELAGDYKAPVALMGRVPCRVTGPVTRGAMMVSNGDGTARAEQNPVMGSVIGKALESFDGSVGIIEIVVGKL